MRENFLFVVRRAGIEMFKYAWHPTDMRRQRSGFGSAGVARKCKAGHIRGEKEIQAELQRSMQGFPKSSWPRALHEAWKKAAAAELRDQRAR